MKTNILLIILLTIICCVACQQKGKDSLPESFIDGLIKDNVAFSSDKIEVPEDIEESIRKIDNHFSGFIYVLDASCSICIAKICEFSEKIIRGQVNLPIIVYVDEKYLPIVEYYTNRIENIQKQIIIIVDKHKHINRDVDPDFVFFLNDMNVSKCFYYTPSM